MTSESDIVGKTILVTGASSGLGRSFARFLAGKGAKVAAAARRVDLLASLSAESDGTIVPVTMDVCSVESIQAACSEIERNLGPIEVLVNNAGVALQGRAVDTIEADFDRVFATNIKGAFFVAQACARRMIELKIEGRIVNIASVAGQVSMPQLSVYGMSKAAVAHMTRVLANEWGRYGLSVNALAPGYLATELNAGFFASEVGVKVIQSLPKKRIGDVEDFHDALLLLASPTAGRLMNGAIIVMDDGYCVR
jgi:NAD(P)-dependent dehydrogenase (short-subunit alcohol dehydrogenase family)